jgi:hypothetical protein
MAEHIVFLKDAGAEAWREMSRYPDRDTACEAAQKLLAGRPPGSTAKVDPGGELFLLRPDGTVMEVMSD